MLENYDALIEYLEDKKRILLTTHNLVDIDGLASCFSLRYFLNRKLKNVSIQIIFQELSKPTKDFLRRFKEKFPECDLSFVKSIEIKDFDILIILDTNNLAQLDLINENTEILSNIPFIFIDHHIFLKKDLANNNLDLNIIEDEISSTSEIIFEFFKTAKISPNLAIKYLLLAGILTDSGFFKYANKNRHSCY